MNIVHCEEYVGPDCKALENFALSHLSELELDFVATEFDYCLSQDFDSHNFPLGSYTCPVLVRFQMTDLDTDYIRDFHFDNQDGVPDNYCYDLVRAIDIAADCSSIPNEIVLIWSADAAHNCIDLEIDYDLGDSLDYNCFHNPDFLDS